MLSTLRRRGALLGTRFGRRLFLLFCLAAIVPTVAVFWMTYRTAGADARQAASAVLSAASKEYALAVYGRLLLAQQALARAAPEGELRQGDRRHLTLYFDEIAVLGGRGSDAASAAIAARAAAFARERGQGAALQVLDGAQAGAVDVVLLRSLGEGGVLAARLRPEFLWGIAEELRSDAVVCAYAGQRRLFCGGRQRSPAPRDPLHGAWTLFLKPHFAAPSWTFVASGDAAHGLRRYVEVLLPVAVGVVLLSLLLSSIQIRRVLEPLAALVARIRMPERASARAVAAAAARDEQDEFALLSQTFGDMGRRIGRQVETLHALSEIDRLILARAPLAEVIDRVLACLRRGAEEAAFCVVVGDPDPAQPARCHWPAQTQAPLALQEIADALPPRADGAPQAPSWQAVTGDAAARLAALLPGVSPQAVFALDLGARERAPLWVLAGFAAARADAHGVLAEIGEIAERIAVAAAFAAHERRLRRQALHDSLTGLPNRRATYEALSAAIAEAGAAGERFAVAFLDLDRFKAINDGLGHGPGDEVLIASAQRIRDSLRGGDFVARFGGDEFVLILRATADPAQAADVMAAIERGFAAPIAAGRRAFLQRVSAGVAFYPGDGEDAAALIRHADVAMYRAKQAGGGRVAYFDAAMRAEAQARLRLEEDLRRAIEAGDIEVHYQPRVDCRSGRIVAVEALARWTHPSDGAVPPPTFIALAEECGLIEALGAAVLDTACRTLAGWHARGLALPLIGVNVSGRQLRSDGFVDTVRGALAASGIAPSMLEIEVTETMLVEDSVAAGGLLQRVREMGVKVAIDDFGTGFSSLAYLTRLPSDTLKIDRAFVQSLPEDAAAAAVVRSIVAMAQALDKQLVAEGVESQAQVALLRDWGCHTIQGYVYHRPMPAADIERLLAPSPQG